MQQHRIDVDTPGRGFVDLTARLDPPVRAAGLAVGLAHVFVQHTSCSLVIQENADPDVRVDLEAWMARHVPDGDPRYRHTAEGPDDMPAHIRAALTATALTVPIADGRLALGTWQGIYLYEHRTRPHRRRVVLTVWGERGRVGWAALCSGAR